MADVHIRHPDTDRFTMCAQQVRETTLFATAEQRATCGHCKNEAKLTGTPEFPPGDLKRRETEYLVFEEMANAGKTRLWVVRSRRHNDSLGAIRWYGAWRQYVLATDGALFNRGCLADIDKFIEDAMTDWRKSRARTSE